MIKVITFIISFLFICLNCSRKSEIKTNTILIEKEGSGISIYQCKNYSTKLYKKGNIIIGLTYNVSDDDCNTVVDTMLDVYKDYRQIDIENVKKKIYYENHENLIENLFKLIYKRVSRKLAI